MPLLIHQGPEGAIPIVPDDQSGTSQHDLDEQYWRTQENPALLDAILNQGPTVIVAHCAAPWLPFDTMEGKHHETLIRMLNQADASGWNLFADISAALFGPIRGAAIREVLDNVPVTRLIYGSDFPIPTQDLTMTTLGPIVDRAKHQEGTQTRNWLDMDYLFKASYGIESSVFTNTATI